MSTAMRNHAERLARAYLLRTTEPPAPAVVELVRQVGPIDAAQLIRSGRVSSAVAAETSARRHLDLAEQDCSEAQAHGARLLIPEDEEWPAWPVTAMAMTAEHSTSSLAEPLALWVRGTRSLADLADLADRAIAVVGARAATGYGEQVSGEFGYALASAQYPVISGAAYGIDGCAHRGALAAGGPTIAVLACGIDISYPAGHRELLTHIAAQGLVLSEYAPGVPPAKHRFLVRNRLIAAFSRGIVVVEAGRRSGARNTANTAGLFGKVVMAVPGPITSAMSIGCHELLRTGEATLVGSPDEVIELTAPIGSVLSMPAEAPARDTDGLSEKAARLYDALSARSARSVQRIMMESGIPLPIVLAGLAELEMAGLVKHHGADWMRISHRARSA